MNVIIRPKYTAIKHTDIADIKLNRANIAHITSMQMVEKKPILIDLLPLA